MGKTFAFGVPLLQRITTSGPDRPLNGIPRALIVVPTRELCLQVYGDLSTAAQYLTADDDRKLSVVSIYGGRPYEPQIESLRAGADVVVGTPGRLLDLAQQGHLQLGGLSGLTRCSTWASCPTSSGFCAKFPTSGRRCSSRRPCRIRSSRWPARS
jgi:superfamily II DNA/RNA helicase